MHLRASLKWIVFVHSLVDSLALAPGPVLPLVVLGKQGSTSEQDREVKPPILEQAIILRTNEESMFYLGHELVRGLGQRVSQDIGAHQHVELQHEVWSEVEPGVVLGVVLEIGSEIGPGLVKIIVR